MRMKALLVDQHVIAGIGNIYADEILHAARIHPETAGSALRRKDIARLHESMTTILSAAVGAGGSTLRDARYVDLMGAGRLVPGRPSRLRADGRALPHVRARRHQAVAVRQDDRPTSARCASGNGTPHTDPSIPHRGRVRPVASRTPCS